jgi:acetyl esterase/lipase
MSPRIPLLAALLTTAFMAHAQSTNTFPLWADGAPGALGQGSNDVPTLTVYLPEPGKANGAAMVICPGGGYAHLAAHEGKDYALWFNESGIAGFVLKYRLGSSGYHHPAMLQDAARAMRTVRARAAEWGIDTKRIGIIGSSAGGHLASTLMTHFDAGQPDAKDVIERASSRPDVGILCYPVITFGEFAHGGSRENLLGKTPSPELIELLSNERQVTKETPPCFIWSTEEDKVVPVENTMMFGAALRKAKVPFDMHIYQKGPHGIGLGSRDWTPDKRHPWTADCLYWLREQKFVK